MSVITPSGRKARRMSIVASITHLDEAMAGMLHVEAELSVMGITGAVEARSIRGQMQALSLRLAREHEALCDEDRR